MARHKAGLKYSALCLASVLFFLFLAPIPAAFASGDAFGTNVALQTSVGADADASDTSQDSTSDASGAGDASAASDAAPSQSEPQGLGLYVPSEFEPQAQAVCLLNEDTGLVAYEKNADEPLSAASLVKMMTSILAAENIPDLDGTMITADQSWIFDELALYREETGYMPSHADIRQGETLSARELLYATLLPSGNEAAMILADYVSGGHLPNFLHMMNARAQSLGCTNTTFVDVSGLSPGNITTARDMTLITQAFMQVEELVEIAQAPTYEIAAHEAHSAPYLIHTTNRLIVQTSPYYQAFSGIGASVVAGKTGSLETWQNYASKASKEGENYICVVLNSPTGADALGAEMDPVQSRPAIYEAAQLYDWAFSELMVSSALDVSEPVTEMRVLYSSQQDNVRLLPLSDIGVLIPKDAELSVVQRRYELPDEVEAPVEQGQEIGSVTLILSDKEIGTVSLVAESDVERNTTMFAVQKVQDFFTSGYFVIVLLVVMLAAGAYAALVYYAHRRRKKAAATQGGSRPVQRQSGVGGTQKQENIQRQSKSARPKKNPSQTRKPRSASTVQNSRRGKDAER